MPKYSISAEATLEVELEPDGYFELSGDDVTDFSDDSSFFSETQRFQGEMSFKIEAEDEEDARQKAEYQLEYNMSYLDHIEWRIEDVQINDLEEIEEPMTQEKAIAFLQQMIEEHREDYNAEMVRAIEFLIHLILQITQQQAHSVRTEPVRQ